MSLGCDRGRLLVFCSRRAAGTTSSVAVPIQRRRFLVDGPDQMSPGRRCPAGEYSRGLLRRMMVQATTLGWIGPPQLG
jgi:hypothetical protein